MGKLSGQFVAVNILKLDLECKVEFLYMKTTNTTSLEVYRASVLKRIGLVLMMSLPPTLPAQNRPVKFERLEGAFAKLGVLHPARPPRLHVVWHAGWVE